MTQATNPTGEVEVTQVDREAAVGWYRANGQFFTDNIGEGFEDSGSLVQAFARHRLTASTQPMPDHIVGAGKMVADPPVPDVAAIPVGMKPWAGGNSAPEDWDGGTVLFACGEESAEDGLWAWDEDGDYAIVAYTPKPAPVAVPVGMKLVLVDPTPAMIEAARGMFPAPAYRAMLAAAPDVATGSGDALAALIAEQASGGPHEWGYRDPVTGDFIADDWPFRILAALSATHPTTAADRVGDPASIIRAVLDDLAKPESSEELDAVEDAIDRILTGLTPTTAADTGSTDGVEAWLVERLEGSGYGPARQIVDARKYNASSPDFWIGEAQRKRHRVTALTADKPEAQGLREALERIRDESATGKDREAAMLHIANMRALARTALNQGDR